MPLQKALVIINMDKYMYKIVERNNQNEGIVNVKKVTSSHPTIENDKPKKTRKTLEERIAGVIKELVPDMIATALKPIIERLDRHEEILLRHEKLLMKHEEILLRHEEILLRHEEIFKRNNLH